MNKSILAAIAGVSVVALSVTPAAAVAVTSLPAGDTMVTSQFTSGEFNFLDENWAGETRFGLVANEQSGAIGLTFNPADGLIYGVNGWNSDQSAQQVFSVDPITGASEAWDIDYGNSDSSGYETRSIAFDGDGNLVALVCETIEFDPGQFDCSELVGLNQFLVDLTLVDDGVAEAGDFLALDYSSERYLASVAWSPVTESFFVLGYEIHDLMEVSADGGLSAPFDVTLDSDPNRESTDLAFDSDGVAWINYNYGGRVLSFDLSDETLTDVADGLDAEGMTILRPYTALAETGVGSTNLGLLALTAISALGAGAWFARRRRS